MTNKAKAGISVERSRFFAEFILSKAKDLMTYLSLLKGFVTTLMTNKAKAGNK